MGFQPVREVVMNQAMRLPATRRRARRRHTTGIQSDPEKGRRLFEELAAAVPGGVAGVDVLELGPGRGTSLMRAAIDAGVGSYAAFDVEPYLSAEEVAAIGVDHRVDATGTLPWPDASFDVVWSHSVMEHVREPEAAQAEVARVLRPGGVQIAEVDFQDHYRDRRDPAEMYAMLKYTQRSWDLMTSRRSSWVNRLRYSDWRRLLADTGFEEIAVATEECRSPVADFRRHRWLDHVADEDLLVRQARFVVRRPLGP